MIIQHMNNVLVKHSKILFGVITIVIIFSFVWFLTPGADGSLLFQHNSAKAGKIFDQDITTDDLLAARKNLTLRFLSAVYEQSPEHAKQARSDFEEDQMFQFAALVKAAEKLGLSVSDEEVAQKIQSQTPFCEDKKFSQQKYDAFKKDCLEPNGFNFEDFENSVRADLLITKLQEEGPGKAVLTDPEVENELKGLLEKVAVQTVLADPREFLKNVKADAKEILALYDSDGKDYQTEPESDALIVFVNFNSVKAPEIAAERAQAYFKANPQEFKDKDGKELAEKDALPLIVAKLQKEEQSVQAGEKLNQFFRTVRSESATDEAFAAGPAKWLKEKAEKAALQTAAVSKITVDSPALPAAGETLLANICGIAAVNGFSPIVKNGDAFAFALLTGRTKPRAMTFEEAKPKLEEHLKEVKASNAAKDAIRAIRLKLSESQDKAKDFDAVVKAAGCKSESAEVNAMGVKVQKSQLGQIARLILPQARTEEERNQVLQKLEMQAQYLDAQLELLSRPEGTLSEPQQGGYALALIGKRTPATPDEIAQTREIVREMLLKEKQDAMDRAFWAWLGNNVKRVDKKQRK